MRGQQEGVVFAINRWHPPHGNTPMGLNYILKQGCVKILQKVNRKDFT